MPRIRSVEQALRLSTDISRQTYVCRSCRANTTRQFHTSLPLAASQEPFLTRMRNSLFGSKESKEAEKRREERTKQKIEELRGRGRERGHEQEDIEEVTGKGGRVLEVAPFVDPAINKDYVVATTWDELENVGSEKWVKAKNDRGEQYVGYGRGDMSCRKPRLTVATDSFLQSVLSSPMSNGGNSFITSPLKYWPYKKPGEI